MKINVEDFKPKVDRISDKYSWRLYKFLNKYKDREFRVMAYHNDNPKHHEIIIQPGSKYKVTNRTHGRRLCDIFCQLKGLYKLSDRDYKNMIDITEEFFSNYKEFGRCIYLPSPMHKWVKFENKRVCEYCGKAQNKITKMVEIEEWIDE